MLFFWVLERDVEFVMSGALIEKICYTLSGNLFSYSFVYILIIPFKFSVFSHTFKYFHKHRSRLIWIGGLFFYQFLFPFIKPKSEHFLPLSLIHSLTNWLLFRRLDRCDFCLLRCQLKTSWCVADGDPEEPVDNSLVEILMMRFGRDFKPEFWSRYWSWKLVKLLRLKFGQDFVAKDWS